MNMNRRLKDTSAKLTAKKGIVVAALHGELEKQDRQNVVRNFARGETRALVVSDVAARGLDFPVRALPPPVSPHSAHIPSAAGKFTRALRIYR